MTGRTFQEICKDDSTTASLIALSVLALRHISEEKKYLEISSILESLESDNKEILKIKEIYSVTKSYDKKLIDILLEVEKSIISLKDPSKKNSCASKKNPIIKKWWEV